MTENLLILMPCNIEKTVHDAAHSFHSALHTRLSQPHLLFTRDSHNHTSSSHRTLTTTPPLRTGLSQPHLLFAWDSHNHTSSSHRTLTTTPTLSFKPTLSYTSSSGRSLSCLLAKMAALTLISLYPFVVW